ncbi:MAG: FlaA locus 22.9 kDa protein [Candidatus Magnetoglobus multicellularis str. Araruama]|uniref:FlaA locus 22.9 kDa protein n=1 Tax=Candidatus Magnetoglobus multicellularis str. Araruama TaxID=890399 RepID=A0A1V1PH11_9BACT|nr:MAG: FlaA locus 22.9 kDa protein [Candidatus Magnetoglobus multicellularis str. Araruama]
MKQRLSASKIIYRIICSVFICKLIIMGALLGINTNKTIPVIEPEEAIAEDSAAQKVIQNEMTLSMDNMEQKDNFYAKPENNYLQSEVIQREREKLIRERQKLETERQHLETVKKEIDEKIARLTGIQETVQKKIKKQEALIAEYNAMQENTMDRQFKHLLKIYSSMRSKKSAKLIDKLDMDIAIRLLSEMKGEQVGQILSYVPPEKAATLSERLARSKMN